jgi:hypothetical protein
VQPHPECAPLRFSIRPSIAARGRLLAESRAAEEYAGMDILNTIALARYAIDFGVATTNEERGAVLVQRFRVYQREGYYRDGVAEDRDEYDPDAIFFLAKLRRATLATSVMVGSARLLRGREGVEFPCQKGHRFDLPRVVLDTPPIYRAEVGRLVSEMPREFGIGQLVTMLGLLQAMAEYHEKDGAQAALRCGVATIKLRLLRGLRSLGLPLHEIPSDGVIYPPDGPVAGYFYRHPDPVVPVYWLIAKVIPSIRRAVARYRRSSTAIRTRKIRQRSRRPARSLGGRRTGQARLGRRYPGMPKQN